MTVIKIDYVDRRIGGYELGVGVSTLDGSVQGSPLEWTKEPAASSASAADTFVSYASETKEFYNALNIETEVSASYGLAHASAKFQFAQECTRSSFSTWLVVRSYVDAIVQEFAPGDHARLGQDALDLLKAGGAPDFIQKYGDRYVSGFVMGGEFLGVLEIRATSLEEQQQVKESWKVGGELGKLSAETSGSVTSTLRNIQKKHQVVFHSKVFGPAPDLSGIADPAKNLIDPDKLVAVALGFQHSVQTLQSPERRAVLLQEYRTLSNAPAARAFRWPDFDRASATLSTINGYLQSLGPQRVVAAEIADNAGRYGFAAAPAVRSKYQGIVAAIDAQVAAMKKVADHCLDFVSGRIDDPLPPTPGAPPYAHEKVVPPEGGTVAIPNQVWEKQQIIGVNGLAVQCRADRDGSYRVYGAPQDANDPMQVWTILQYPDVNGRVLPGRVLLVAIGDKRYALGCPPGGRIPHLEEYAGHLERNIATSPYFRWRIPEPGGGVGQPIAPVPDHDGQFQVLSFQGDSGWAPGQQLQLWEWNRWQSQYWEIVNA
jgi:hypothetical protein